MCRLMPGSRWQDSPGNTATEIWVGREGLPAESWGVPGSAAAEVRARAGVMADVRGGGRAEPRWGEPPGRLREAGFSGPLLVQGGHELSRNHPRPWESGAFPSEHLSPCTFHTQCTR